MTSALPLFRFAACRGGLVRHCARGALGIARTAHGTDRSFFAAGWMPPPSHPRSRSRGLSVSRRDADIPPRKEHAMKEPPPRKRGRKSRRAAAAADLVPDEPFEDVRARARRARDFERMFLMRCRGTAARAKVPRACDICGTHTTCFATLRAAAASLLPLTPGRAAARV